jgi:hypothetical protein
MTQQGRNMQECVTIDDKTLFVHLLVISVFVYSYGLIILKSLLKIIKRPLLKNVAGCVCFDVKCNILKRES